MDQKFITSKVHRGPWCNNHQRRRKLPWMRRCSISAEVDRAQRLDPIDTMSNQVSSSDSFFSLCLSPCSFSLSVYVCLSVSFYLCLCLSPSLALSLAVVEMKELVHCDSVQRRNSQSTPNECI